MYCYKRCIYPSDVIDAEWVILEPLIPAAKPEGRPQENERREIVDAILYVLHSGCSWLWWLHGMSAKKLKVYLFSYFVL
jgi:transposase